MLIIFEGEKSIFFAFLCGICCIEVYNLRREKCPFLSFFVLDFPKTKFTISGGGNSAPSLPSRQTGGSSGGGYRSAVAKSHQKSFRVIKSHQESSFEICTVFPHFSWLDLFLLSRLVCLIFNPRRQVGLNEQRAGVHGRPRQLQPQRQDRSPDQGGRRCHQLWLRVF